MKNQNSASYRQVKKALAKQPWEKDTFPMETKRLDKRKR